MIFTSLCVHAEEPRKQNLFDWYYAAVFGTGVYSVAGRDVFMLRIPYERQLRAASDDKYAIYLSVPLTVGIYDFSFDSIPTPDIIEDVATLTLFPGIFYDIPINERWRLRPFINLGYGTELSGGDSAWIYSAGIRSVARFRAAKWRLALGNALFYGGNTREGKTDVGFAAFEVALDAGYPTGMRLDDQPLYLGGYAAMYVYSNLEFLTVSGQTIQNTTQYELGVAVSTEESLSVLGMKMNRISLGYLYGDEFTAIRLGFSFPY